MLARLGHGLYWAGCAVAVLAGGFSLFPFTRGDEGGVWLGAFFLGIAAVAWIAGRALRYVLAGE